MGWLETRTDKEMSAYDNVMAIAHDIIAEGFSREAITPGITTTEDLEWWYRQRVNDLGLTTWFHNSIEIERPKKVSAALMAQGAALDIIYPGDHVHIDFGITYLNLQTDTQQNAYISKQVKPRRRTTFRERLEKATHSKISSLLISGWAAPATTYLRAAERRQLTVD